MTILLIEDDQFVREIYTEVLEKNGFEVDSAGTGKEGLRMLKQNKYDLLLLDIMLPDTNGLQILKQVKQNPATATLKTILLTNLGQDTVIEQGYKLGADKYLIKAAYNPDQIVKEVESCLNEK